MTIHTKAIASRAIAAILTMAIATSPSAQVPDFGYRVKLEGIDALPAGGLPPVLVPPTTPGNDGQPDFDAPSNVPYGIVALVGEPVSLAITTRNGAPPVTWSGPTLQGGLNFSNGAISGTATAPTSQEATFTAQDGLGRTATATVSVQIVNAAVSLTQYAPIVRVGAPFQMRVNSNIASAEYALTGAPGMTRGPVGADSSVAIAGTATAAGTFPVAVQAGRTGTSISATASASVEVLEPLTLAFSPATIPATAGTPVSSNVVATGAGAAAYRVDAGLEAVQARGLTLSGNALSGTLLAGPAATLTLRVTDPRDGQTATASITAPAVEEAGFTVASTHWPLTLRPGAAQSYTVTSSLPGATFELVGAPDYVTLTGATVRTVAPDVSAQEQIPAYAIRATDPANPSRTADLQIANPGTLIPSLGLAIAAANGRGNVPHSIALTRTGAIQADAPITLLSGALPRGMSIAANAITGTPDQPGASTFTLRVTDSDGTQAESTQTVTIGPSLTFALSSAANPVGGGTVGSPMSITATPQNHVGTVTFENAPTAARPANLQAIGLTVTPDGEIAGTPQSASSLTANIRMTEAGTGAVVDMPLQLAIQQVATPDTVIPVVQQGGGPDLFGILYDADTATRHTFAAGAPVTYTFPEETSITGATTNAPGSFTVQNVSKGTTHTVPAGTANANRTFTGGGVSTGTVFRVQFTSATIVQSLRLTNGTALTAPSINVPTPAVRYGDSAGAVALATASGASGSASWSLSGALPSGISFDPQTAALSGTSTAYGNYPVTLSATDARGAASASKDAIVKLLARETAAETFPVYAAPGTDAITARAGLMDSLSTPVALADGQSVTVTFANPVTADGFETNTGTTQGTSMRVVAVDAGETTFDRSVAQVGANAFASPATSRSWTFTNTTGAQRGMRTLKLTFQGQAQTAPSFNMPMATVNIARNATLTAAQGAPTSVNIGSVPANPTWSHLGALPPGVNFDSATGTFSGSPSTAGSYPLTVSVTNAIGIRSVLVPVTFNVN